MKTVRNRSAGSGPGRLTPEAAETLAIQALSFLAADAERLERFMSLSGLSPENLRAAAADPGFLVAVLDHLARDEALLVTFAESVRCEPSLVIMARNCLDPPETSVP
jgi:hypothetical protein